MNDSWVHIGRLWTNGEPFLAVDAELRAAWRGMSDDEFERVIVGLPPEATGVAVGSGRGVLVGADGVVRDDSWIEVFEDRRGAIAFVQASGDDYREALLGALAFPMDRDEAGESLSVPTGKVAVFSAAVDGTGELSQPLLAPRPGPVPLRHGPPTGRVDPGMLLSTGTREYRLGVRWYTELSDGDGCFARWLLTPA